MLKVWYGTPKSGDYVYRVSMYFDMYFKPEWIESDFGRRIIKEIDDCNVIHGRAIELLNGSIISPLDLAGGTKALLLMNFTDDKMYNASVCGDNCIPFIQEIAARKDLRIRLGHNMWFKEPFEIAVLNNGKTFTNSVDLMYECYELINEENEV